MGKFCVQCAIKMMKSLRYAVKDLPPPGMYRLVECDGCGPSIIDYSGRCVSRYCAFKHGIKWNVVIKDRGLVSHLVWTDEVLNKQLEHWRESFKVFVQAVELPEKRVYLFCGAKLNDYYGSENALVSESVRVQASLIPEPRLSNHP